MYKVFINEKEIILTDRLPAKPASNFSSATIKNKKDFNNRVEFFLNNLYKEADLYYFLNKDPEKLLSYLKDYTKYIEAAGGLVKNPQNEILLIYRYGKWDLPKGKKEPNESPETTAKREVIEECGIGSLSILNPLISTYHMYTLSPAQWVLKKTFWYLMHSGDWQNPTPQVEENISKVIWVNPHKINDYLSNTYGSIRMLIETYFAK